MVRRSWAKDRSTRPMTRGSPAVTPAAMVFRFWAMASSKIILTAPKDTTKNGLFWLYKSNRHGVNKQIKQIWKHKMSRAWDYKNTLRWNTNSSHERAVNKTCGLKQVLGVFGGGSSFSFLASLPSLSFFSSASFISTSFSPSFLPLVSSGMALLGVLATQSNLHLSLQATKSKVRIGYKRYFLTWTWCRFTIFWSPLERERQWKTKIWNMHIILKASFSLGSFYKRVAFTHTSAHMIALTVDLAANESYGQHQSRQVCLHHLVSLSYWSARTSLSGRTRWFHWLKWSCRTWRARGTVVM